MLRASFRMEAAMAHPVGTYRYLALDRVH
ncbi:MAG: hypothetical protein RLZ58_1878, partial [Pseudomonadota bacterium]